MNDTDFLAAEITRQRAMRIGGCEMRDSTTGPFLIAVAGTVAQIVVAATAILVGHGPWWFIVVVAATVNALLAMTCFAVRNSR